MGTLLDSRLGLHELLRTPLGRRSDDLTRWPLVDSSYGRTDKTNRDNLRRCHRSSPTRREHRLQGKQGARGPPLPEVGPRHATLRADRAGSRGWVPGAARLLQWWRVHGRGPPGALFLGILTGLLAFVPLVGSIVSAIPPLLLAFVVGSTTVLWVLVAYVAIQQIEGNLVEPLIMQKTASLHPAAVVTVVAVLGAAFGLLGSILAVPSAIVAAILVKELWFRRLEEARNEPKRNAGNEGTPEKLRQTVRDA